VTGFGLAGHLSEMLLASNKSAQISLPRVPLLSGCQELINAGIESSLADSNRAVAGKIEIVGDTDEKNLASLFDPQTGGGLLIGVSSDQTERVLAFLHGEGFCSSAVIGEVGESDGVSKLVVSE
jgi:selenide,water dikinase